MQEGNFTSNKAPVQTPQQYPSKIISIRYHSVSLGVLIHINVLVSCMSTCVTSDFSRSAHMRRSRNGRGKSSALQEETANESLNPFKRAEKKYKKYQHIQTDFRDVIDFHHLETNTIENRKLIRPIYVHTSTIYSIEGHEGLFILPGFISESTQLAWARRCLEVKHRRFQRSRNAQLLI